MSRLYWSNFPLATSARNRQRLLKLVDHRGLADARRSGHEHELRRSLRHDSLKSLQQGLDLAFPAVEPLRKRSRSGTSCDARERRRRGRMTRARSTSSQVLLHARGGLVAVLGSLGEELQDEPSTGAEMPCTRSPGGFGALAMWDGSLRRVRGRERKLAGEHL